jgi:uncharacterized protein YndB with AHSA1/START domain
VFDAPRELVFRTVTDPKLIPQWWGREHDSITVEQMDVRRGGVWRFVGRNAQGEYTFTGVYHLVIPNEQIVQTFEFEPLPSHHVALETMTLEDYEGKTRLNVIALYQSVEDRDWMLSGMETGLQETYQRLDTLLETLQPA